MTDQNVKQSVSNESQSSANASGRGTARSTSISTAISTTRSPVTFEPTPNPSTMKFNLGFQFLDEGFNCPRVEDAERSPLAMKIFGFPWASAVYIGTDYVTVTKQDWVEWSILAQPLSGLIQEHLDRGEGIFIEGEIVAEEDDANDTPLIRKIKTVLKEQIRPVVALDGGDISFKSFQDGILSIQMKGACSGCPSSMATLKDGIEVTLKDQVPEVKEVIAV